MIDGLTVQLGHQWYRLVAVTDHPNHPLQWETACCVCGHAFTIQTGLKVQKYQTRTCERHRGQVPEMRRARRLADELVRSA